VCRKIRNIDIEMVLKIKIFVLKCGDQDKDVRWTRVYLRNYKKLTLNAYYKTKIKKLWPP